MYVRILNSLTGRSVPLKLLKAMIITLWGDVGSENVWESEIQNLIQLFVSIQGEVISTIIGKKCFWLIFFQRLWLFNLYFKIFSLYYPIAE